MPQRPDLAKREAWWKRLQDFERGGERIVDFCRRLGVPVWSFYYWKQRLRSETVTVSGSPRRGTATPTRHDRLSHRVQRVRAKPRLKFVPIQITGQRCIEVHLPSGTRLTVPCQEHDAIGTVIAALVREPVERGHSKAPERRPC